MNGSEKYQVNLTDLKKIGIGAGIAIGGALMTYLTGVVSNTDFGAWTPIVVSIWSIIINILRKFLTDNS